jgi:hypothetical protein
MNKRFIIVSEIALAYFLILGQIWFVGKFLSVFTILPLGVITLDFMLRKESLRSLGLCKFDFKALTSLWVILATGMSAIVLIGFLANHAGFRERNFVSTLLLRFGLYLVSALFQQIVFNGYFVNRIQSVIGKQRVTAAVAGFLFCTIHAPNLVLLILTLFGGTVCAHFFIKTKNVYPLAVAHAALGALAYCALPQAWHHGFRVGMQYYLYIPTQGDRCAPSF